MTAKSVDVIDQAKSSDDPNVQKVSQVIENVLSPFSEIALKQQQEESDRVALEAFIQNNPEASDFKDKLWEAGKTIPAQYNEIWANMKLFLDMGYQKGSDIVSAKAKASAGGMTSNKVSTGEGKAKLTPRQIELARKCGHNPEDVY